MNKINNPALIVLIAFIAGFLSVLIFHQPTLLILKAIALAPDNSTAYGMASTSPLGIPRVFSLAFWGGIWGIVLAVAVTWTRGLGYWLSGLIIGALGPSLVNWFVVLPLKGKPVGGGWAIPDIATALIVNAAWGLGTVLLFRLLSRSFFDSDRRSAGIEAESEEKINR